MVIVIVDKRGKIVIPKELRIKLGLKEGMVVEITEEGSWLKITPVKSQSQIEDLKGCITEKGKIHPLKVKKI
jgi:AbrB family looped-hinge helix DNA binding protein